jgi:hypothetical protein
VAFDPYEITLSPYINAAAQKFNLPPSTLISAVAPNGFKPEQLQLPASERIANVNARLQPGEIINAGAAKLAELSRKYGNTDQALADYRGEPFTNPEDNDGGMWAKAGTFYSNYVKGLFKAVTNPVGSAIKAKDTIANAGIASFVFFIGALLIILGLYALVMKGSRQAEIVVKNIAQGK